MCGLRTSGFGDPPASRGWPAVLETLRQWTAAIPVIVCAHLGGLTGCDRTAPSEVGHVALEPAHNSSPRAKSRKATADLADADYAPKIVHWGSVEEWPQQLAIMETVFWEPDDTTSLRKLIRETDLIRDKRVLEIGTGSGLVALCCLRGGAQRVVATDINPNAIRCAAYNARQLGLEEGLELRQVSQESPSAFAVIAPDEQFDLIISNPPWEDQEPKTIAEFALYDRNFALLGSLLDGLPDHLTAGGRAYLAYGCVDAIRTLQREAESRGMQTRTQDDRDLTQLPEVFLPGMLIEVVDPGPRKRSAPVDSPLLSPASGPMANP